MTTRATPARKSKESRHAAFSLRFAEEAPELMYHGVTVSWHPELQRLLHAIGDDARQRRQAQAPEGDMNLPYADLRARLHVERDDWFLLSEEVGLRFPKASPEPWAVLPPAADAPALQAAATSIRGVLAEWVEGSLAAFMRDKCSSSYGLGPVREWLHRTDAVNLQPGPVALHPWRAGASAGEVAQRFSYTARFLAAQLAGHEIFPEASAVVLVQKGNAGNSAEVMTTPMLDAATGGRFSLVCELRVETLPGAVQPLIYCRFMRRRWASALHPGYQSGNSISAYVLPHGHRPYSAYRFTLNRTRQDWSADQSYAWYEKAFGLTPGYSDEAVLRYPSDAHASVVVSLHHKLAVDPGSKLQAGLALVDHADAFENVARVLAPWGLKPFEGFRPAQFPRLPTKSMGLLKASVLLGRLLSRHPASEEDADFGQQVQAITQRPPEHWFGADTVTPQFNEDRVTRTIRDIVEKTGLFTDEGRRTLLVLSQTPSEIEWIKSMADALWGNRIQLLTAHLPADTHGARADLPGADETTAQRFNRRMAVWEQFASDLRLAPRTMVLVHAAQWYAPPGGKGKLQHDDDVNKPAARKALARAGCTVQYLLPSAPGRLKAFIPRVQAALVDLVFGHAGLVWGIPQACAAHFPESQRPRWICAVSTLRAQQEFKRKGEQSVVVACKVEVATGQTWVRFAHATTQNVITGWMRFDEGAQFLSQTEHQLPKLHVDRQALLTSLLDSTLRELHHEDPNAVVFLAARQGGASVPWLTDARMSKNSLGSWAGPHAEHWPNLRVLRVREQAPVTGEERMMPVSDDGQQQVPTWTLTPTLLEVKELTTAPTFWSRDKIRTHAKRGASAYRVMRLPPGRGQASSKVSRDESNASEQANGPEMLLGAVDYRAISDQQHLNSQAIELVVLQRQPGDTDVQLAAFAQQLRIGLLTARVERWVTAPSPLRILEKLAEYMRA